MKTLGITLRVAAALLLGGPLFSAMAVTFTSDSSIGVTDFSDDGRDIVVTNCTLTVDGVHRFNSILVQAGGVLTHSANTNGPVQLTFTVQNEAQFLSATNPATLNQTNITANTIVVSDISSSITYTQDVDYTVSASSQSTQLLLTTNSAIAEGAEVLVSYSWAQAYQGFNISVTHDAQVAAGGAIDISGKGYAGGFGSGAGASQTTNFPFTFTAGGGGAHGGGGGMSSTLAPGGGAYDSTSSPGSLGSGGGTGTTDGGAGGGLAQLTVTGTLQVDGQIVADGLKGTNAHSGGGAGGGILLSAQTISGAGNISANGGAGDVPDGGGGGGGRIAISSATNTFTGTTIAFGGSGAMYGGAGTIYVLTFNGGIPGHLFIDNGGNRGASTLFSAQIVSNLVVSGGAVAQAQTASFLVMNLLVRSNCSLIPPTASSLTITVNGDATVETNGALNVDAVALSGPGAGRGNGTLCTAGSGGGYGGAGGASACGTAGGGIYGSMTQPTAMGSSGGNLPLARGGGAIIITVQGTLSLAGNISANGAPATQIPSGGGSGGSVLVTVGTLVGGGNISANGGSASNSVSGGGGGGRVAVYFGTNQFTGNVTARGGGGINPGGPGTVYLLNTNTSYANIIVDNGGLSGLSTLPTVISQADVTISGGAIVTNIGLSATLGNWLIGSNSSFVLMPSQNPSMFVNATNVTVQAGGGIITDGVELTGAGQGQTFNQTGGGGGGGGIGGASASGAQGGLVTSSTTSPSAFGGPGGTGQGVGGGGSGGGVVRMFISHNLQVDGTISANGSPGLVQNSGGGGGGSIALSVNTFTGAGTLAANGGAGNNSIGGGGAGGRVAILYVSNLFTGVLTARGGAGANFGGAGTVYTGRDSFQQMTIDNGGNRGAVTGLPTLSGSFNLAITGGSVVTNNSSSLVSLGNFLLGSNSVFLGSPVSQNQLTVATNATIQAGAVLSADGVISGGVSPGQTFSGTGGGGSYGGIGGMSSTNAAGGFPFFDTISGPTSVGSHGGSGLQGIIGGNGGGGWRITVNGKLQLDGKISAEGVGNLNSLSSGGGSGGSIWINASSISGAGVISVNGGPASFTGSTGGGGGGGGRIALFYNTNTFTGTLTAFGGPGVNFGGAGTIYLSPNFFGQALSSQLTVDNGGAAGNTLISQFPSLNFSLTVAGWATLLSTNSTQLNLQNFLIGSNSAFIPYPLGQQTILVLTNATIQPGGRFAADGQSTSTVGAGQTFMSTGGGGGHGGYGGASLSNALGGNVISDQLTEPTAGSRGGGGFNNPAVANGGGSVHLTVNGIFQLDGRLSADGVAAPAFNGGGGSGGGIFLAAGRLLGAGAISANGGAGNNIGGGGGGGRIALSISTNLFTGSVTARGGPGANAGGAGTILYSKGGPTGGPSPMQLIVDNGGLRGTNTLLSSPPISIDVVVGSGAAITLPNGSINWLSLLIASNATVGVVSNGSPVPLIMNITSNLTVQAGGAIQLNGAGFSANSGPGAGGLFNFSNGGGGGHGGLGSAGVNAHGGATYDSIVMPGTAGSGGGAGSAGPGFSVGSAGGGLTQLTVGRILMVDGAITANGLAGAALAGGGAGGGIYLKAGTLAGAGKISADGGDGDEFDGAGGGGGGRIAVFFTTNNFTGTLSAHGGAGTAFAGGAGTIYLKTNQSTIAQLVLDNAGTPGTNTPLDSVPQLVALTVRNGAAANTAIPLTFQNITLGDGGLFNANSLVPLNLTVLSDLTVQPGGTINADADGYSPTNGPGNGNLDAFSDGSGGGYGGAGGTSAFGAPGGVTYGSSNQPVSFGSAGGMSPALANFSQGGGAVRVQVNGHLTLDGNISADGNDAVIDGSGGGSGGSIWITTPFFAGAGLVTANGGNGESTEGGGGGGGRIAIYTGTNLFSGNAVVAGGGGVDSGQTGTIVIRTNILVSGSVTDTNGIAIAGITLQPSGLNSVITDINGAYAVTVPLFWNGSIMPSGNYFFVPNVRTYSNLSANSDNQNFLVADPADFNLSSGQFDGTNVGFNWYGINGVTYQVQSSTDLVNWVPYGPPIVGE